MHPCTLLFTFVQRHSLGTRSNRGRSIRWTYNLHSKQTFWNTDIEDKGRCWQMLASLSCFAVLHLGQVRVAVQRLLGRDTPPVLRIQKSHRLSWGGCHFSATFTWLHDIRGPPCTETSETAMSKYVLLSDFYQISCAFRSRDPAAFSLSLCYLHDSASTTRAQSL